MDCARSPTLTIHVRTLTEAEIVRKRLFLHEIIRMRHRVNSRNGTANEKKKLKNCEVYVVRVDDMIYDVLAIMIVFYTLDINLM